MVRRVVNEGALRRRFFFVAGVVRRIIDRVSGIKLFPGFFGFEIVFEIQLCYPQ